jgi:hypothetical protein
LRFKQEVGSLAGKTLHRKWGTAKHPFMRSGRSDLVRLAMVVAAILFLASCGGNNRNSGNGSPSSPSSSSLTPGAVTVYPGSASVPVNGTVQFMAFVASAATSSFTWSVSGGGTINASTGAYTAPASPATVTVTATSSANSSLTGTATLQVSAAQGVQLSPAAIAMPAGATQTFTATMNGTAVGATWQVNGTPGGDGLHGTIDSSGTYSAPLTPPPGGTTTITAITGSGSTVASGTATVAVIFSNASLNGSYAFSYKGNNSAGFSAVVGSFIAQGTSGATGQIFGGVEDVLTYGSTSAAHGQFTGTFSVNADGTATATLPNNVTWQFALSSNPSGGAAQQALLIRFDTSSTGSGTINAQNPALLTASAFSGNYAFGLSGVDGTGAPLVIAGRFFADGVGTIPPGSAIQDINDNGKNTFSTTSTTTTTTTTADTTLQGSFEMDATSPNSGRGTLTLSSTNTTVFTTSPTIFHFAFYIVDNTHIKAVEIDNNAALAGDFYSAVDTPADGAFNSAAALPKGNYAFTVVGTGGNGAYAAGGILNSAGASTTGTTGTVTGVLDVNNGTGDIRLDSTISSSSYTVDPNFGRIALPLTVNTATTNFAGYTASYTTASGPVLFVELIELDANAIAVGVALPQTPSSVQGSYSLNLAGASGPKNGAVEQDILGQVTTFGSTSLGGNLYINNLALKTLTPHLPLTSSTAVVSPTSNGRGTATLTTSIATFALAYYVIDANSALLLETDGSHLTTGIMSKQF